LHLHHYQWQDAFLPLFSQLILLIQVFFPRKYKFSIIASVPWYVELFSEGSGFSFLLVCRHAFSDI
jgi:hypothetical protein